MEWLVLMPFVGMALVWLLLPGVVLAWCGGQRGLAMVGLAPVLSVAVIGLSAIVASWLGLSWGPVPVVGFTVLAGLVLFGVVRGENRWRRRQAPVLPSQSNRAGGSSGDSVVTEAEPVAAPEPVRLSGVWWPAALLVAVVLFTRQFVIGVGAPTHFSQAHDIGFHLNAVRWAVDHLDASSLVISQVASANPGFYPGAWHGAVSLVDLSLASTDVVLAANGVNWVILAVLWPISGLFFLSRVLRNWRWYSVLGAGVLVASFPAVLWAPMTYGVLYPNALAFAVLPALLGLTLPWLGIGSRPRRELMAAETCLLLGGLAGLAIAHPNALLTYVALMAPVVLWQAVAQIRRDWRPRRRRALVVGSVTAVLLLSAAMFWLLVRPEYLATYMQPRETWWQALAEVVLASPLEAEAVWILSPLLLLGGWLILRRPDDRWLLGPVAVGTVLWLAVGAAQGSLRYWLVGTYYSDAYRVAVVLGIVWLPAAMIGLGWLGDWLADRTSRFKLNHGLPVALLAVVVVGTQFTPAMSHHLDWVLAQYDLTPTSRQVNSDEYALIQQLPELIPPGVMVASDAWTGSGLAYALAGVPVTMSYVWYIQTPDIELVIAHLDQAGTEPGVVCPAVQRLNVQYALDFGEQEFRYEHHPLPRLEDLGTKPGFSEVARVGQAALYHIDACWE